MISGSTYVPTLAIRPSEMNGLEQLPGITKDRLFPVFLLAPWATANNLIKSIERVERAYPDRPYFLDIDRYYAPGNAERPAQQQYLSLLNPSNNYENWREFVLKFPNAFPSIQLALQNTDELVRQIQFFQENGRQFCIRIEFEHYPQNLPVLVSALNSIGTADYCIILDAGWTRDALTTFGQFSGLLAGELVSIDAGVPVVVSCTSIPLQYSNIVGVNEIPFSNHMLIEQLRQHSNRSEISYGDWGSTRPREYRGGGQPPFPRIDFPTTNSWYIARNQDENWSFEEAAQQIIRNSGVWEEDANIWGVQMIAKTANNQLFAINTPQKNVAARVNIHLHKQAFFGIEDSSGIDFDEDWED